MKIPRDSDDQPISWPKKPPPGAGASIGQKVEYTLAEGVRVFLDFFDEPLAEFLSWCFRLVLKVIEKTIGPYVNPLIDEAMTKMEPSDPMRVVLSRLREARGEAAAGILTSLAGGTAAAGLMSIFEPWFELARQNAYQGNPYKLFDMPTLISQFWRRVISRDDLNVRAARLGYRTPWLDGLMEVARPRVGVPDLTAWLFREPGRMDEFKAEMSARGYKLDEIEKVVELFHIIPPAPDLIRMAVREAFDPDIVSTYKLDADLHKVPYGLLEKVGLSREMANYYWYAHWVLPSVLQGYEMLHRGEITEGELKTLMKSLDIMPGWIDHLINISYRPYTRVDVRRMHATGVLDEPAVLRSYRDIGYDLEKATKMTEFTVAYNTEEERDATKTDILTAYFEGVLTRDEAGSLLAHLGYTTPYIEAYLAATDYRIERRRRQEREEDTEEILQEERALTKTDILSSYLDKILTEPEARAFLAEIDYPPSVIDILIAKTDHQELQRLLKEEIATTRTLYVNEEIDRPEVYERLGQFALPATQIRELLTRWDIEKERKVERPSVSQLLTFYFNGIINEAKLRVNLARHKFLPEYIDLYVANANYLILERERKELEREQKEQERLDKAEFKTARMVRLAELNTQIAEWKVVIAELRTMMVRVVPPGTKQQMRTQIRVKEEEIAGLKVMIAERKEEIAKAIELAPTLEKPEEIEELNAIILSLKTEIAEIETQIAILREEIANIRTELSQVVEPDEKLAYEEQVSLAREEIAKLQLQKAEEPVAPPVA